MRELPTGTVTFLFTDIEGSTRLLHELGDGYVGALAEHRRLLREAFAARRGVEVDTQGDAFFVAFARASDAVAAAAEGQAALAGGPIRVRMSLHTGEPTVTEEGYVGLDVHRAARIAAAGHGGQVVLSQATTELVEADARDLGEHRLKDLSAAERLYQLGDGDFPRLKTLYGTNLPVPATPFLGRERELREVTELLARDELRLLTVTGPGGTGKTRLALQAAAASADGYPQGVWWVPLAPVADAAAVLETAALALGGRAVLAEAVGDRRLLLLLDNFEHVIDAAPELSSLLAACPNLDLLVTSRERLQVAPEHVYVAPVLARTEARAFFASRARAVRPEFEPDEHVDELCARLDDLPLAIELAAARVVMLSPAQLLERLGRRLDLLRGGRDADVRQRTLRATLEWSHDLLDTDEQRLLARLALFSGGCTLEAAEAVCAAELDTLQSLVDKSLVRLRDGNRFWMLETIREFAAERLAETGDEEPLRRAHADWFHELALETGLAEDSARLEQRHELVEHEGPNLRAALDWAEAHGDVELALSIAVELEGYWTTHAPFEAARRFERLLARGGAPPALHARALRAIGSVVNIVGNLSAAGEAYGRSLEEFRALGDEAGVARLLNRLAGLACLHEQPEDARRLLAQLDRVLPRVHAPRLEAMLPGTRAQIEELSGDLVSAFDLYLESAQRAAAIRHAWWEAVMTGSAAEVASKLDRTGDALRLNLLAIELCHAVGDRQNTVWSLGHLAVQEATAGNEERSSVLWGAVEAEEQRGPVGAWEQRRHEFADRLPSLSQDALARGRALSLDEAVAYALSVD